MLHHFEGEKLWPGRARTLPSWGVTTDQSNYYLVRSSPLYGAFKPFFFFFCPSSFWMWVVRPLYATISFSMYPHHWNTRTCRQNVEVLMFFFVRLFLLPQHNASASHRFLRPSSTKTSEDATHSLPAYRKCRGEACRPKGVPPKKKKTLHPKKAGEINPEGIWMANARG